VGPNHVLPTGGAARHASPLSVRDFTRRSSRVFLTRAGLRDVADDIVRVAEAEGLRGHALSVLTRFAAGTDGTAPRRHGGTENAAQQRPQPPKRRAVRAEIGGGMRGASRG
jgi:hypothetical protein